MLYYSTKNITHKKTCPSSDMAFSNYINITIHFVSKKLSLFYNSENMNNKKFTSNL